MTAGVNDSGPFAAVREREEAVEALADRDDRIGSAARVSLALARDERPDMADLETLGIPVGPSLDVMEDDE